MAVPMVMMRCARTRTRATMQPKREPHRRALNELARVKMLMTEAGTPRRWQAPRPSKIIPTNVDTATTRNGTAALYQRSRGADSSGANGSFTTIAASTWSCCPSSSLGAPSPPSAPVPSASSALPAPAWRRSRPSA